MIFKKIFHSTSGYKLFFILFIIIGCEVIILFQNQSKIQVAQGSIQNSLPCQNLPSRASKAKCFDDVIQETLDRDSLDKAFQIFGVLFDKDPQFAADCHQFAHGLGEKAYELFAKREEFSLSPKSSYCGYGFYHGFMEVLLHKTNDMKQAREFCDYAEKQLHRETYDAGGACFHGIGHGAVEDVPNKLLWGNAQAIINPSLALCERVSDSKDRLFRCVTGVFNALEIISTRNKYNLSLNKNDPFWICRLQPEKYKKACYTQMVVAAMNVAKSDFVKSAQFIDTIPENEYAFPTLSGLVVERVRLGMIDFQQTITFCRNLSQRFHIPCITGFGEGFLKYGPPESEYKEAIRFCSFSRLTGEEREACFSRVLSILRIWYTAEKASTICNTVDKKYQFHNCVYY